MDVEQLRKRVESDADLGHITPDLRPLAVQISALIPDPQNARKHPDKNLNAIKGSLAKYGQRKPVVVNARTGVIEAGNGTVEGAIALGWQYVAAAFVDDDAVTATGYGIADNRASDLAVWDDSVLASLLTGLETEGEDLEELGFADEDVKDLLDRVGATDPEDDGEMGDSEPSADEGKTLSDRFIVPPFSVLDARQGYWQERKRAWLALGIKSELGRGGNLEGVRDRQPD